VPSDWERVAADPALLAALRARYAGSGDPLDRLWWAEHPGEPTPAGLADPGAALERSRRDLYRPGSDPGDAARIAEAEADASVDRDDAVRVLAALDAERPMAPFRAVGPAGSGRRLLVGAVVAALVIGGAAGLAAGRFTRTPDAAALRVFDRSQREADRPPATAPLPSIVVRSSLREIGSAGTSGTVLYAARARDGRVCLVAVVLAAHYVSTCATDTAFAAEGLTLGFEAATDPDDDSGVLRIQQITTTWSPDGAVRF
jgi:hypothetical protein